MNRTVYLFHFSFLCFVAGILMSCKENSKLDSSPIASNKNYLIDQAPKVDSQESTKWYYSIEEAKKDPDQVKYLSLREQGFKVFPEEIIQFENLEDLDISMNQFTHLSKDIGKLKNLKSLSCSYGNLVELPKSIGKLKKLERLWLLDNKLKALPEEIGDLSNLKDLNLFLNPIENIPESFFKLQNLRELGFQSPDYGPIFSKERQKQIQDRLPICEIAFGN